MIADILQPGGSRLGGGNRHARRSFPLLDHVTSVRKLLGYVVLILGLSVAYVWEQVETDKLAHRVQILEDQRNRNEYLNEITRSRIAELSHFNEIEEVARTALHMEFPSETPKVLVIPPAEEQTSWLSTLWEDR